MNRAQRREQDRGLRRAVGLVAAAEADPLAAARALAEAENMVRGAYAIMHVLVTRNGGPISITREEMLAMPRDERVDPEVAPNGDVTLTLKPSLGD